MHYLQLLVSDWHQHSMDAVVSASNDQLCKHHHVTGVHCAVRDPVLLCQWVGGVHDKLICGVSLG